MSCFVMIYAPICVYRSQMADVSQKNITKMQIKSIPFYCNALWILQSWLISDGCSFLMLILLSTKRNMSDIPTLRSAWSSITQNVIGGAVWCVLSDSLIHWLEMVLLHIGKVWSAHRAS